MTRRGGVVFLGVAAVVVATAAGAIVTSSNGRLAEGSAVGAFSWVTVLAVLGVAAAFATAVAARRTWHRPADAAQSLHVPCEPDALVADQPTDRRSRTPGRERSGTDRDAPDPNAPGRELRPDPGFPDARGDDAPADRGEGLAVEPPDET